MATTSKGLDNRFYYRGHNVADLMDYVKDYDMEGVTKMTVSLKHHSTCRANYPEKLKYELPQHIEVMKLDDKETVHTCVDCGAFVLTREEGV